MRARLHKAGYSAIKGECNGCPHLDLLKVQQSRLLHFGCHIRLRLVLAVGQQGLQVEEVRELAQRDPHLTQKLQLLCRILQLSLKDLAVNDACTHRRVVG